MLGFQRIELLSYRTKKVGERPKARRIDIKIHRVVGAEKPVQLASWQGIA
jgi:hypothetical protein